MRSVDIEDPKSDKEDKKKKDKKKKEKADDDEDKDDDEKGDSFGTKMKKAFEENKKCVIFFVALVICVVIILVLSQFIFGMEAEQVQTVSVEQTQHEACLPTLVKPDNLFEAETTIPAPCYTEVDSTQCKAEVENSYAAAQSAQTQEIAARAEL